MTRSSASLSSRIFSASCPVIAISHSLHHNVPVPSTALTTPRVNPLLNARCCLSLARLLLSVRSSLLLSLLLPLLVLLLLLPPLPSCSPLAMSNRDIDASDPALAQAWKEMSDQKSENNWYAQSVAVDAAHVPRSRRPSPHSVRDCALPPAPRPSADRPYTACVAALCSAVLCCAVLRSARRCLFKLESQPQPTQPRALRRVGERSRAQQRGRTDGWTAERSTGQRSAAAAAAVHCAEPHCTALCLSVCPSHLAAPCACVHGCV